MGIEKMNSQYSLQCRKLSKFYTVGKETVKAVNQAEFSVRSGDFITILGHSGSGKTTLLSMIGGLTKPDEGEVIFNGRNPWLGSDQQKSQIRNSSIGFIFQFASLIPTLTVLENVLLPLSFESKQENGRQKAAQLLEQVGLAEKTASFPGQLSGGQQRRVAIARAFVNDPELILADEPTGDLDEDTEAEILSLFREINGKGTTFLVVTHNRDLHVNQPGARVFQMKNGELSEGL